tara:strand:+ start:1271 stop:2863 length:1593 start_codon:yes stop_codon:yes gene_type:complete
MNRSRHLKNFGITIFSLIIIFAQHSCKKKVNYNQRITVASSGKVESIDPARINTLKSYQLLNALGDTLYELNEQGKLIPKLAAEMPIISKDKLKIIIKLKKNILFHDGTSFDSSAMKFTIERFQKIGTANYLLDNKIKSIETPQKYLLVINLNKPSSSFIGLLTSINLTAISPSFYKNHFDKFLNEEFIGTGKYKLERFNNDLQILSPNKNYWGIKAKNDGINFIGYNNSATLYGALRSKQIDVLLSNSIEDTLRNKLSLLSNKNEFKEGYSQPTEISFISLRSNSKPLKNNFIRLAIAKSLNKELISKKVSYGLRKPAVSIIPSILKKDTDTTWPNYDPLEAIAIFRKQGYCDGNILNLDLTYRSNVPTDKLIAFYWQQSVRLLMKDCFSIKINGVESTTIYKNLKEGIYPAVILDWTGAYSDPEAYLSPLLKCNNIEKEVCLEGESVFSGSFWASKKVEELFLESESIYGLNRLNKLNEIEKIASKSLPYIPIWISSQKAWSQNYISKPRFNSAGRIIMSELEIINEK